VPVESVEPARATAGSPGPAGSADLAAPADRGALRIADRVIAKTAAQAAREALPGTPARPRASVSVRRSTARVRLAAEAPYPADLPALATALRLHVAARVEAITGLTVKEVAIDLTRLHSAATRASTEPRLR
jgi:uncharacterized alkaline shock family protein YloU